MTLTHALRPAVRVLAVLHALAGLAVLLGAGVLLVDYANSSDDDALAVLGLVIGLVFVALAVVLVALGLVAAVSRRPGLQLGTGVACGLVGVIGSTMVGWIWSIPAISAGVVVSLALVVCAVAALLVPAAPGATVPGGRRA